jgi:hypothetical protein
MSETPGSNPEGWKKKAKHVAFAVGAAALLLAAL